MSRVITERVEITDEMLKPSKRLVDANALEVVGTVIPSGIDEKSYVMGMEYILNKIDSMPTIEERKKGKWIERNPQNSDKCRLIECDQCGFSHIVGFNVPYEHWIENRNFCERCGADMRKGEGEKE